MRFGMEGGGGQQGQPARLAAAATQQAPETPMEQLTKLMDLRERGMLTDAAYEARSRSGGNARVIGYAAIEVRPNDYSEVWQLHGPRNLRVVCSPGGDYVAVLEPDAQE
jgi:hypothetical protein